MVVTIAFYYLFGNSFPLTYIWLYIFEDDEGWEHLIYMANLSFPCYPCEADELDDDDADDDD